jgi:hypothetical protein
MLSKQQYERLLPYKKNWNQLNSAGEMHCNINCWTAIVTVGLEVELPFNKKMHMKIHQSCPTCMSEVIKAVMPLLDEYEAAITEDFNTNDLTVTVDPKTEYQTKPKQWKKH